MLILQRKKNESIMIGQDIEIIVTEVKGESIKLGIKAPKQTLVYRKEIYDAIMKQNIQSASQKVEDLDKVLHDLFQS